jgi:hypothetical protein
LSGEKARTGTCLQLQEIQRECLRIATCLRFNDCWEISNFY